MIKAASDLNDVERSLSWLVSSIEIMCADNCPLHQTLSNALNIVCCCRDIGCDLYVDHYCRDSPELFVIGRQACRVVITRGNI